VFSLARPFGNLNRIRMRWTLPFALLAALAGPAVAQDEPDIVVSPAVIQASYGFYWTAFKLGKADLTVNKTRQDYRFRLSSETDGAVRWFFRAKSTVEADGAPCVQGLCSQSYRTNSMFNEQSYRRVVEYAANGRAEVVEKVVPQGGWGREREPVADASKVGPDPVTAMVGMLFGDLIGPVNARSFDGAQVVEYRLSCQQTWESLPKTGRSSFSGQARPCELKADVTEGKAVSREADQERRARRPLRFWVAEVSPGVWAPVRFVFTSRRGSVTGYITRLSPAPLVRTADAGSQGGGR
jgi:hypothetical protein